MEELASARGIPFQAPIESAYVIEPKTHRIQDRVFNVEKKACVALFLLLFQSSAERERESVCVCQRLPDTCACSVQPTSCPCHRLCHCRMLLLLPNTALQQHSGPVRVLVNSPTVRVYQGEDEGGCKWCMGSLAFWNDTGAAATLRWPTNCCCLCCACGVFCRCESGAMSGDADVGEDGTAIINAVSALVLSNC